METMDNIVYRSDREYSDIIWRENSNPIETRNKENSHLEIILGTAIFMMGMVALGASPFVFYHLTKK